MRKHNPLWIASFYLAVIFRSTLALAGPVSLPLITELDMAKTVFVGKITDITKEQKEQSGDEVIVWGCAVFEVSELLKGAKEEQITATVLLMRYPNRRLSASDPGPATIYRTHRKGEEGIWVILWNGHVSNSYGLLEKGGLNEVKADLEELNKRAWSDEVNGLKVSALKGSYYGEGIFFTAKNVSGAPVYLPLEHNSALARNRAGKEFVLTSGWLPLIYEVLQPGEVGYLNLYIVPKDLQPDKYSVTVTLINTVAEGKLRGKEKNVTLWTGHATAPAITVEIPKQETKPDTK